jgi:hypothetical protein
MDKNETNEETVSEQKAAEQLEATLQQSALVVCSLFLAELKRANEIYPVVFRSSTETLGSIHKQCMALEAEIACVKTVDGFALDEESRYTKDIKRELVQLGAMCIKAAYSLCNLEKECAEFSETLRLQTIVNGEAAE